MRGVPFHLQEKGVFDIGISAAAAAEISGLISGKWIKETEPTSVLEPRRSPSPSPPSSTSLGGGSIDTAGVAAVSGNPLHKWPPSQEDISAAAAAATAESDGKEVWTSDLQPFPATAMGSAGERCSTGGGGIGMEDWENVLPGNEQSFFRWFVDDMEDPSLKQLLQSGGSSDFETGGIGFGLVDSGLGFEGANVSAINPPLGVAGSDFSLNSINNRIPNFKGAIFDSNDNSNPQNPIFSNTANGVPLSLPLSLPHGVFYQQQMETIEEKPQLFNPQLVLNQQQALSHQNPAFFLPLSYSQQQQQQNHVLLPPQPKRHHPAILDPEIFLQRQPTLQSFPKPKVVGTGDNANQQQQQALVDQLFKAAEMVESGNSVHARGILARLNHQLSNVGKPLMRAAFYFKEALQLLLNNSTLASSVSPLDLVFKISAYKVFSEISPFLQFVNFTSNQALLEALDGSDRIHIVDFDIGIGGQWASFMQEVAMRIGGAPSLKITAFASLSSHHPLELCLTQENLTHFANDLNISFEFNVVNLDAIDPSTVLSLPSAILNLSDNEAVAVNFPIGSSNLPVPLLLRLVKRLSPKIVVSVDHGCDRSELPFSQQFLHGLQSYAILLDSLDAVNVNSEAVHKIEKFLVQPRIQSSVLGRHGAREKMPPWRTLFSSAGLTPLAFSNFTETQAECMVRRLQVRGFHVEKRQATLYLCWQRGELCSVSAWRC